MPAAPKPSKRIVDPTFYERVRREQGFCLYGLAHKDGCAGMLEVHHIKYRGRGGDDTEENAIVLCKKHHQMVHRGEISAEELHRVNEIYLSDTGNKEEK